MKPGPKLLPRDERGWRIPHGAKSRAIYDLLIQGKTPKQILAELDDWADISVLVWKIKHPERANAYARPRRKAT